MQLFQSVCVVFVYHLYYIGNKKMDEYNYK